MSSEHVLQGRLPHFEPPSPASRSALQHCSTMEIQLASTSMTGVGDGSESDDGLANNSTILPAFLNTNNSLTMLLQETYDATPSIWESSTQAHSNLMDCTGQMRNQERESSSPPRMAQAAKQRAVDLAKRLRTRGSQGRSTGMSLATRLYLLGTST